MISIYEELLQKLKLYLKNKNIKFNKIVNLINNKKYDEIIEISNNDPNIQLLITDIETERIRIGNSLEKKLNNLVWLNERLIQFGEEPQLSKNKAQKLLKSVSINIYDLESEKYEKTTRILLKKELRSKASRRFPLISAKENETLKCFLIKL